MFSFERKKFRQGLRPLVTRVVVAALVGSLLVPVASFVKPLATPAAAAVANGSISLPTGATAQVGKSANIGVPGGFTYEAWVKFATLSTGNNRIFYFCSNGSYCNAVPQGNFEWNGTTGKVNFDACSNLDTNVIPRAGEWYHLAVSIAPSSKGVSYGGAGARTNNYLYINGTQVANCFEYQPSNGNIEGFWIGGTTGLRLNLGPFRVRNGQQYTSNFTPARTFTSTANDAFVRFNTPYDDQNASSCFANSHSGSTWTYSTLNGTATCSSDGPPPLPPAFSYTTSPVTVSSGAAFTAMTPTQSGSQVDSYSISPALSNGLALNTTTGVISGTAIYSPVTSYVVTGTQNSSGLQATANVSITVNKLPSSISITLSNSVAQVGVTNTITATASVPGNVSFQTDLGVIPGCSSVATTTVSPFTATCPWEPVSIYYTMNATLTPTSNEYAVSTSSPSLTNLRGSLTLTSTGQTRYPGEQQGLGTNNTLRLNFPEGTGLITAQSFTIETWIKVDNPTPSVDINAVYGYSFYGDRGQGISIVNGSNTLSFAAASYGGNYAFSPAIAQNAWQNLVFQRTYVPGSPSQSFDAVFLNGVLINQIPNGGVLHNYSPTSTDKSTGVRIGPFNGVAQIGPTQVLSGVAAYPLTGFSPSTTYSFGANTLALFQPSPTTCGSAAISPSSVTAGIASTSACSSQFPVALPRIESIVANSGPQVGGNAVTITGNNFVNLTGVKFGNTTVAGTNYTVNTFGTQINVTNVPPGTSAVDVTVITAAGTSAITTGSTYTYLPTPTITNLNPSIGDAVGNNSIVITGTGFTNASAVMFGSKPASSFTVNSSTQITAISPSGTGTVGVQVTAPGGTTLASNFTYNAATSVNSVTPNSGSTSGNTTVEITGTNFTGATAVKFGIQNATSFTVVNSTRITAVSPAGSAGIVGVTVVVGGTDYTLSSAFTYTAAVAVSGISVTFGPTTGGTVVQISGTNFTSASTVVFGANAATNVSYNSVTGRLTATSPAGTGAVNVRVTTDSAQSPISSTFTYFAPPTVTGITPATGTTAGGTSVVITGTNFKSGSTVTFGTTNVVTFTINSLTQITATSPAGSGTVDVRVTNEGGTSENVVADNFTYFPRPTVASISPATGTTAGATSVTITGENFIGTTGVKFGTSDAVFTVNSATQITATAPAGTGEVNVTVITPGGTSAVALYGKFTYVSPPTLSSISPSSGMLTGGQDIIITGTGLNNLLITGGVLFGTIAAQTVSIIDSTQIRVVTPATTVLGEIDIFLVNSSGSSAASSASKFTYTKSNDAKLSTLTLSQGTLVGAFSPTTNTYTASVINSVDKVTLTPTVNQANATVQVKVGSGAFETVASGAASLDLPLVVGANTILVKVTAHDETTVNTYTITLTRLSNDATLFAASIKAQTATLGTPNAALASVIAGEITLTTAQATGSLATVFTKTNTGATITRIVKYATGAPTAGFETDTAFANSATTAVANGDFFIVKVTAADGTVNFYRFNVTVNSDVATLSGATIKGQTATLGTPSAVLATASAGTITLTFAQSTGNDATTFTKTDAGATVTRIVKYATGASTANFETATAFTNGATDAITNGDFFIVKVTAADATVRFYRVNVTVNSNVATLSAATVIKGLSPSSYGTSSVTLGSETPGTITLTTALATGAAATTFVKTDVGATITKIVKYGTGATASNFEIDTPFANSATTTVANGDFFIIKVTAQDGTVNYSRFDVTVNSNVATLSAGLIKGQSATVGTAGSALGSLAAGTITLTTAQATGTDTTTFTKTDAGATITKIVKLASSTVENSTNFNAAPAFTNGSAATISNGDYFIVQVTAADATVRFTRFTVTVNSNVATLSGASIKGLTSTLGTPNTSLASVVSGTITLTPAQATGTDATTFTKTDAGATIDRIVKYGSGAPTANFETDTAFTNGATTTLSNNDFFIIKVTAADGSTLNYYRINVISLLVVTMSNVVITAPVAGAAPQTSTSSNGQFTTTISWSGTPTTFAAATAYTAQVTVVPDSGYTLTGVSANFFRINGITPTSVNLANAGVFSYLFPATAASITTANVLIAAPAVGATPQTSTTSNGEFTTTITWSGAPTTFAAATAYTATVTVTPDAGRTLFGVTANFFTLNNNAATSANLANSGVFSYQFPATTPAPTITNLDQTLPNYGTTVNVTGTNFTGATVVKIGNTPVATFTVVSATSLSFVVNSPCCTESTISITTPGGTVTSVATITPQPQLAVIATQPVAVSRNVDQSVTFSVVVTAPLDGGVLSYQWIKGVTPIQGATSATLTFTPTAVSQAGNYYVAVYNTVSGSTSLRASNTAVLTLNKATPVLSSFAAVNKTFGDTPFTITAPTSSVAGSFSYQSGTTSVATVNGSTITIVGQGTSVITANFVPQNTDDYVSNVTITMTLTVAARQLATPAVPTVVVTSGTLKSFTVSWNAVSNAVAYALKIYAANGVTLLRTVSGLSGTSKLINATDFPAIADGTEYKIGLVATGDANNAESAQSVLASVTTNAQYTITYNSTNSTSGTAPAAATFITGSSPHLISTNTGNLARTSFSFSGWNTAADGSGTTYLATGAVPVSPTANLVLHPRWIALKFTVTYYGNNNTGGTVPTDGAEYLNGASVTVLGFGTLVRRGYNFTGWTTDAANTSAVIAAASTRTINLANLELYAKWEKVPYTVRYNTQGGSTVSNGSYKVGESITLPASPTRAGHTFNGWFANSTGGTALSSTYSPPAVVTNWSLIYQTTQPFRTSGAYVYTSGYGLGSTDAAKTLMNAGRTFNKVRYRMEATYNGVAYYADVSFDKWSGGGTPSSVAPTIDKLAIPGSIADAVQTNVTGCVIDSNWPGFTGVATSVTKGTGKTCRLEVWHDSYSNPTSTLLPAGTGNLDQNDTRAGSGTNGYGSFQVHNVTSGEIQTVLAWNKHGDPTNPDLGFGSRSGTNDTDWTFAGKTNFNLATWKLQIYIDDATVAPTEPAIENIDLYAQWTPIPYTVAYNGNLSGGGSAPVDSATYINGSSITVLGNTGTLTRTGYTFANWSLNADGTGTVYAAGSTLPVGTSNVTFYARWIAIPYSVTYNATSSTGGSAPTDTSTYTIGQNVPVRGNPGSLVRTGYTFSGWTDNSGGSGTVYQSGNNYLVGSANISFHPKWTANNYTITYNKNGASGLPAAATSTFTTDGNPVTLTSVGTMTKTGFNFGGWSTTSTGSAISGTYTTTADVTLYAVWTIKSLTVTYSEGSATRANLSGFPSNTSGNYGTTITLNATISATTVIDSAQHAFMGWSDGTSVYQGGSSYLLGETSPTFTALWAKIFAVRYSFNGGTPAALTSDIDPECLAAGNTCTDGQIITANAAPTRTGYTFAGWVDQNNVAVVGSTFTVASNRYLLYATWTPENYAITYNTAGGSTPEATFTKQLGQSFTVAAAPTKTGHTFTGWSDGTTIVNPGVTYNVSTSPVTLTAQWSTDVYTVSYDPNGGSGSAIANVSYTFGANAISLPTVGDLTRSNFTFAGWSETPTGTSVGATYTPTISRTLYVVWTVSQYLVTYSGNGGTPSAASATYSAGSSPLVLPTATRANFTFQGWYSSATDGVLLGLAGATYAPASATTIYARWIQDSLIGVPASSLSFISSYAVNPAITATNTFSTSDSAVSLRVPAGSLPAGTTVTNWLLSSDEYARALLPGQNNYLLSLVVSWLNNDGTVPVAPDSNPLVMTITNSSIKAGARVYSVVGTTTQLLGVATQDGSVSVNLTTDPQIYVLQTRPAAPTNVTATSGEQSSSFVSWSASADDGGSAIINYTVTASDGQRCISATTSCNFGGLTNGTSYTFTVYASNGVGNSDQSTASASITPGTAPAVVVPNPPSTPGATTPGATTPAVTTPPAPVVRVPVRAAYVMTQIAPQISKSADKLICTSGTYSSGFTLDGVVEPGSTSVFTPTSYIYNLLFNLVIQSPLSVTTAKNSASWDLKVAPVGVLVTCTVTATNTSSTVTESSFQNTAATSAAVAAQNKSIAQAESDYKAALVKNSKNYQKALIDNRTKWRADTAKSRAEYNAELARIKKLGTTKSRSAQTSAALKKLDAANKKLTADYKASGPASIKARELADKAALDAKNAAIAKANSNYSSVIESLGFAVRAA